MTHQEIITEILTNNLNEDDLVEIELTTGETVQGKLSDNRAFADNSDINGTSRIGLYPPPPSKPGLIVPNKLQTVYSKNIVSITKL